MMCNPTAEELLNSDPSRDIFEEILPGTMTYPQKEEDGSISWLTYKDAFHDEMYDQWGDVPISLKCVDAWVKYAKHWITPQIAKELGKKVGIWELNREQDVDYANYESSRKNDHKEYDNPITGTETGDMLTVHVIDEETNTMKQPSGPLGSADLLNNSINAIHNPISDFIKDLKNLFLPVELMMWRADRCCDENDS